MRCRALISRSQSRFSNKRALSVAVHTALPLCSAGAFHTLAQTDSTYVRSFCTMRRAVLAGPQLRRNSAMATRRTDFRVFWPTAAARARTAANWWQLMIHVLPAKSRRVYYSDVAAFRFSLAARLKSCRVGRFGSNSSFSQELCPAGLFSVPLI